MLRIEIVYDPSNSVIPLKLNCPGDVNPALLVVLMSQIITALAQNSLAGDTSGLIMPGTILRRTVKN